MWCDRPGFNEVLSEHGGFFVEPILSFLSKTMSVGLPSKGDHRSGLHTYLAFATVFPGPLSAAFPGLAPLHSIERLSAHAGPGVKTP